MVARISIRRKFMKRYENGCGVRGCVRDAGGKKGSNAGIVRVKWWIIRVLARQSLVLGDARKARRIREMSWESQEGFRRVCILGVSDLQG